VQAKCFCTKRMISTLDRSCGHKGHSYNKTYDSRATDHSVNDNYRILHSTSLCSLLKYTARYNPRTAKLFGSLWPETKNSSHSFN
jgi:hypothetical protein